MLESWLKQTGLEQYGKLFADQEVDFEVLRTLTEDDLRELGLPLGARKKLLLALARLGEQSPDNPREDGLPSASAERRQLTIMFCDLVGSTALSQQLDPEALRELMQRYQQACRGVIEKYEGHVAQYLGDGLMVYFGFPRAHEDDAERAVRSALEIVEAVKKVPAPSPLGVRVGIATGPVVVGETGSGDASVPKLAVGETPNMAARLQGLAGPDEIVIALSTHRLLGSTFEFVDLGEQSLKGIVSPVRAYRVAGVGQAEGRFEAMRAGQLTPFTGREEEIALLARRWELAREGDGQVVLLCGEPGIGKSRITQALRAGIAGEPHTRLGYQCSPFHTHSAFYPVIEHLERAAGFLRQDPPDTKLAKLEARLRQAGPLSETAVPLFASLLSLGTGERFAPLQYSPQRQKEETISALCEQITGLAMQQPVLVVFEDAHWIDPSTLETLDLLVQRIRGKRVLVLIAFRPEFQARWTLQSHVTLLTLNRLARKHAALMVDRITSGKPLPAEVLDQIVAKTDGVPLFVEELTKAVLESGLLTEVDGRYRLKGTLADLAIPSTLQDSLMARLDRLASVKEIAQIGACIGRDFSFELMVAVSPLDERQLAQALGKLEDSGLVHRSGQPPNATYTFKHALVQDVAYQSILKTARMRLHEKIATILLEHYPVLADTEPEIIAHHYTAANNHDQAVLYWLKAGQRALARMVLPESIGHLRKASELVVVMPPSTERDMQALEIRVTLAAAFLAFGGWAYSELPTILRPARPLAERQENPEKRLVVLYYLWLYHWVKSETDEAMSLAQELLNTGEKHGHPQTVTVAYAAMALTECLKGHWKEARTNGQKFFNSYSMARDSKLVAILNHDLKCLVLSWAPYWNWALGYPDQARDASMEGLDISRKIGHPFNLIWALTGGTCGLVVTGNNKLALDWNEQARHIAREQSMAFLEATPCNWWGGMALMGDGFYEKGYEMAETGMNNWRSTGGYCQDPLGRTFQARALGKIGRTEDGLRLIEQTLHEIDRTNHRTWEPVTYCVLGDLLANAHQEGSGKMEKAEVAYNDALKISRAKSAKGYELIAATGLANLWKMQGKRTEAYELLAPIYNWFIEGFDTKDLMEAKALLGELSGEK